MQIYAECANNMCKKKLCKSSLAMMQMVNNSMTCTWDWIHSQEDLRIYRRRWMLCSLYHCELWTLEIAKSMCKTTETTAGTIDGKTLSAHPLPTCSRCGHLQGTFGSGMILTRKHVPKTWGAFRLWPFALASLPLLSLRCCNLAKQEATINAVVFFYRNRSCEGRRGEPFWDSCGHPSVEASTPRFTASFFVRNVHCRYWEMLSAGGKKTKKTPVFERTPFRQNKHLGSTLENGAIELSVNFCVGTFCRPWCRRGIPIQLNPSLWDNKKSPPEWKNELSASAQTKTVENSRKSEKHIFDFSSEFSADFSALIVCWFFSANQASSFEQCFLWCLMFGRFLFFGLLWEKKMSRKMPSTSANSSRTKSTSKHRDYCFVQSFEVFLAWVHAHCGARSTQRRKMDTWAHPAVLPCWSVLGKSSATPGVTCGLLIDSLCQAEMSLWPFFKSMQLSGVTLRDFHKKSQSLRVSCFYGVMKVSLLQRNTLSRLLRALRPKWGDTKDQSNEQLLKT